MKRFSLLKVILGISAAFMFAGCSDVVGTVSDGNPVTKCRLAISANAEDDKGNLHPITNSKLGRSILPDPSELESEVKFYISGSSSRSTTLAETELTFTDGKSNAIELEYLNWQLTLEAKKDDKVVLRGRKTIDLSNGLGGSNEINFNLSSRGLDGTGSVDLNFKLLDENETVDKYIVGLYDFYTDQLVATSKVEGTSLTPITGEDHWYGIHYTAASIQKGTYNIKLYFYMTDGGVDTFVGVWTDTIKIDVGNETHITAIDNGDGSYTSVNTNNTIDANGYIVLPDLLAKPADAAPTNLKAWYIEGSESTDGEQTTYNVLLTWEDNSTNEEYFNLQINKYDADGNATVFYDSAAADDSDPDAFKSFYASDLRVDGSLFCGSESVIVRLPTGGLYDFKMEARNYIGGTGYDETVRVDSSTTQPADDVKAVGKTYAGYKAPEDQNVNRVKVTYDLNGGTYKFSDGSIKSSYDNLVRYYTYNGTDAITLMDDLKEVKANPAEQTEYPILVKGTNPYSHWMNRKVKGDQVTDTSGKDDDHVPFEDYYVWANYNLTYVISYSIEGYSDLDPARVTATAGAADCKNAVVDASTTKTITFTVTNATGSQVVYDYYRVRIDGETVYEGSSNTYSFTTDEGTIGNSGTHTVSVCARTAATSGQVVGEWYANSFAYTLSR